MPPRPPRPARPLRPEQKCCFAYCKTKKFSDFDYCLKHKCHIRRCEGSKTPDKTFCKIHSKSFKLK
mgnify:CR=1 FL=1|jgi:hypothetical protein